MKGLIDSLKLNSTMVKDYNALKALNTTGIDTNIGNKLLEMKAAQIDLAKRLKSEHDTLIVEVPRLIQKIYGMIKTNTY
jgi:hypothetical protein